MAQPSCSANRESRTSGAAPAGLRQDPLAHARQLKSRYQRGESYARHRQRLGVIILQSNVCCGADMSITGNRTQHVTLCKTFDDVFRAELADIRERHNRTNRPKIPDNPTKSIPTTALGLTGLACSGGGIRSAAFCLGVLQGLQSKDVIRNIDYLSSVSGGGYIATTMTIGMSSTRVSGNQDGTFPFGRLDHERHEPPEVRHLRDNSRYLLQNGWRSEVSAVVIYLRGIAMNVLVLLPILLDAAALLVSLNPDTKELTINEFLGLNLTFGDTRVPFTVAAAFVVPAFLVVYAILVSVVPIAPLKDRQRAAQIAGWIS